MYRKLLCAFADGRMAFPVERFKRQALDMKFYDQIHIYNETLLDQEFIDEFSQQLPLRGYGYWSWKPQILIQSFSKMEYGDIIQYSDIGCHLNAEGRERLSQYFDLANNDTSDFLAFKMLGFPEKRWTKGDTFDYFNFRNKPNITNTPQFWAGSFIVKKTNTSEKILFEWLNAIRNNFNLIDDSPSKSSNFPEFIEHRHDQSLFSLLAKKYNFSALEHGQENTKYYFRYPILALRDKGDGVAWCKVLSAPPLLRGFIHENKLTRKIRVFIEVLIGQQALIRFKKLLSKR
ncbi:hypothetical protein [Mangrovibacterium sp.]|uniref:hypothetical protein n=1 Tax=Mangrovibacterium sp. TaxID=1961364 RepID=UPI00356A7299